MNKTKNYQMFDRITGNRPLHPGHLAKLEQSILNNNLLYVNPIIVDQSFGVIDGQHRLEVARKNNLDIYYISVPQREALQIVRKLNTNMRGWSLANFVDSNIELGLQDYQILKDFSEKYGLAISMAADLLTGRKAGAGRSGRSDIASFKEGNFRIKGLTNAIKMADSLILVKPYVGKYWKDRAFLSALQQAFKVVGTRKMVKKLSTSPLKIVKQTGVKEYLRNLEEIYNYHVAEKNRVRFF